MTPEIEPFVRWGTPHVVVVLLTLLAAGGIILLGAKGSTATRRNFCNAMAITLICMFAVEFIWRHTGGVKTPWQENLPLHFCSVMIIVSAIALRYGKRWACAMVYFGVLTASIQGLITPALADGYPGFAFTIFFLSHSMLFLSAVAVIFVMQWKARLKDILRSLLLMDAYLLCIIPVNICLCTNYGFTQKSPIPGCILDYLGDAPWYYLWLQLPALGLFFLMYLPLKAPKKDKIGLKHLP